MPFIYEPKGAAGEYARYACTVYKGCEHRCRYCFAPDVMRQTRDAFHGTVYPRSGVVEGVAREAPRLKAKLKPGERVFLSFISDPYPGIEAVSCTTRRVLIVLKDAGIPVAILSKAGIRSTADFDLLKQMDAEYGQSLVWASDAMRQHWEPMAASVESRIEAFKMAKAAGLRTMVSVEPVIDPDQALGAMTLMLPYVDVFKVGKIQHVERIAGMETAPVVDWKAFAEEAVSLLTRAGKQFLLKRGLKELVAEGV